MPSLRESQGIKKDVSGNRNAKKLPINMICIAPQKKGSFFTKEKKATIFDSLFHYGDGWI